MEKYNKILGYLNKHTFKSQRILAEEAGVSLGTINSLLKKMTQEGYLKKIGNTYCLTGKGEDCLEQSKKKTQEDKLFMGGSQKKIHTAVILAAGENEAFTCPIGLLKINDIPVIEYTIRYLYQAGIEKIYVVTGAKEDQYREYFKSRNITLISNSHYKWSGTMVSLSQIEGIVEEDFLLVESNLIFEESAIRELMDTPFENCILLTAPSGSGDEAYVELNEDKTLFRISKDIRQLNHIDGEMIGISKITYPLFQKMLEYFKENTNPMLNYEYVIEEIGKVYQIQGVLLNDMAWTVIENAELYHKADQIIYPKIRKKERLRSENQAKEVLMECMHLNEDEIEELHIGGGMTNTNFFVTFGGKEYILRIPGACTDVMINRRGEQHNAALAAAIGINPATIFFDADSGIKVTECISNAETLNGKTARLEANIQKTTAILKKLHQSDLKLYEDFSVQREYEKYKKLIAECDGAYYDGFDEMDQFFYKMLIRLDEMGKDRKPCHNDLVAENFVADGKGRMYLIDWEYAGYNDPTWDLAAHLIECEFLPLEEELFLKYYYPEGIDKKSQEKILIHKICQDILWSAWTVLKEAHGEDFGSYGRERLERAIRMREEYQKYYEKN